MDITQPRRPFTLDRVVRILIAIAVIGIILWLLDYLTWVLIPFAVACLIAYLMNPLVEWNKRVMHFKGRTAPTFIALAEVIIAITIILWLLVPYAYSQAREMVVMCSEYMKAQLNVPYLPAALDQFIRKNIDVEYLSSLLTKEQWSQLISTAIQNTWHVVGNTLSIVIALLNIVMIIIYTIFILIDYDRMLASFKGAIPQRWRKTVLRLSNDIKISMSHYFRGQALVALSVAVLYSIGFAIVGLPMAIIFGICVGVLNMVPYLQIVSMPAAALLCLVSAASNGSNFWQLIILTALVYIIVQIIQDGFIVPKIMGKSMGLNPAITLLSISIWGTLLGFIGLIIALPVTTLIINYYNRYVASKDLRTQPSTGESSEGAIQETQNDAQPTPQK